MAEATNLGAEDATERKSYKKYALPAFFVTLTIGLILLFLVNDIKFAGDQNQITTYSAGDFIRVQRNDKLVVEINGAVQVQIPRCHKNFYTPYSKLKVVPESNNQFDLVSPRGTEPVLISIEPERVNCS